MRAAVIGAGAAAVGVLAGLRRWSPGPAAITVFETGERLHEPAGAIAQRGFDVGALRSIYADLHATHGYSFPPPKSHFGHTIPKLAAGAQPLLWHSPHRGGLTTFWGGAMFPFTERELRGWPVSAAELAPHYRVIADEVGVTGRRDVLSEYFDPDFANRPALRTTSVIGALERSINQHGGGPEDAAYRIIAGASRLSLETRGGHERACTYSGECMIGCPRRSIWAAYHSLERFEQHGLIDQFISGRVVAVDGAHVIHETRAGRVRIGPFDRVYIAAGCVGSTEIVMRSLGIATGPVMQDNAVLWFPFVYAGGERPDPVPHFSLSNLSMLGLPRDPDAPVVQGSFYPSVDHIFRYFAPPFLWPLVHRMSRLARWRLLIGRVYFGGAANRRYRMALRDDALVIEPEAVPDIDRELRAFMQRLGAALRPGGFLVPPVRPRRHGTSAHYSSTFPYGGPLLDLPRHGRIATGVYLADSSTFPTGPAIHPTFTIMANACRTVQESLDD